MFTEDNNMAPDRLAAGLWLGEQRAREALAIAQRALADAESARDAHGNAAPAPFDEQAAHAALLAAGVADATNGGSSADELRLNHDREREACDLVRREHAERLATLEAQHSAATARASEAAAVLRTVQESRRVAVSEAAKARLNEALNKYRTRLLQLVDAASDVVALRQLVNSGTRPASVAVAFERPEVAIPACWSVNEGDAQVLALGAQLVDDRAGGRVVLSVEQLRQQAVADYARHAAELCAADVVDFDGVLQ